MALHVMQWNARGLRTNMHELKNYIHKTNNTPDIICIQETYLNDKYTPKIDGYTILRRDNPLHCKGGTAIIIKNNINHTVIQLEDITGVEQLGVEINTNRGKIKVISIYISPNNIIPRDHLTKIFTNNRTIIVGDLNAHNKHWKCTYNNNRGMDLEEIIQDKDLVVLNTGQHTLVPRTKSKTNSVIDLAIATKDIALRCNHAVLNTTLGSDHKVTLTTLDEDIHTESQSGMHRWLLKKADWKTYKENSIHKINDTIITDNIDDTLINLKKSLEEVAASAIPERKIINKKRKYRPVPFWTDDCSRAIYERNRLRNRAAKTKNINDQIKYNEQAAKSKRIIKDTARNGWEQYCGTLNAQSKLGPIWRMAKNMSGNRTNKTIPTLVTEGGEAFSNVDKANTLAETYAKASSTQNYTKKFKRYISKNNRQHIPQPSLTTLDTHVEALNDNFNIYELKQAIKGAKKHSTPGADKIPYELIQNLHKTSLKTLLKIYNTIWNSGNLPTEWKHAIILPILKPSKDPTIPGSYRPISLTSCLCKVMERMSTDRLQWFVERKNLLTTNQTGFRKGRNTMDQIIRLQDKIQKHINNKEHVLGIFIDFEKAYDMLHIPTLMRKLNDFGVIGKMHNYIKNFLTNRTFQVKVGDTLSDQYPQENGTPQGAIISSLLFLIMINDIPPGLDGTEMSLFADDSALFVAGRNKKLLQNKTQMSLNKIQKWCNQNGFKISIDKTIAIFFSKERHKSNFEIKIKDKQIELGDSAKFLGVYFDRKLTWKAHIDHIVTKTNKRLNLLRAVSGKQWGSSKKTLLTLYKAIIRPILDYGAIAFCTANDTHLHKLELIQSRALRLSCGATVGTPITALQNECGEMPLKLRWHEISLKQAIKILTTKHHPAAPSMADHWTLHRGKYKPGKEPLYNRTKDYINTHYQKCKGPTPQHSPPWHNTHIKVDTSLTKHINKKSISPEIQKAITLEHINRYKEQLHIYTDGSKFEERTSAAVIISDTDHRQIIRLADSSSVYAAELTAIKTALEYINENNIGKKVAIFTDSLCAAESVKLQKCTARPTLLNELLQVTNKIGEDKVTIIWVPSHVGVRGNEEADIAAKEGLTLRAVNSTKYIERPEMYTKIHQHILHMWQQEYSDSPKGAHYKHIEPMVSTKLKYTDTPRGREVQITRLRLGKATTNAWLHKMRKHPDGECENCKLPETIDHLLLNCTRNSINTTLRQKCEELKVEYNLNSILQCRPLQDIIIKHIRNVKNKII